MNHVVLYNISKQLESIYTINLSFLHVRWLITCSSKIDILISTHCQNKEVQKNPNSPEPLGVWQKFARSRIKKNWEKLLKKNYLTSVRFVMLVQWIHHLTLLWVSWWAIYPTATTVLFLYILTGSCSCPQPFSIHMDNWQVCCIIWGRC